MGCTSSTTISAYRATKTKEEVCTTFSQIDSTTSIPDDIFFEFLRHGKIARNNGSHMEVSTSEGGRKLRRADLWESEKRVSQHSRRANALRPSERSVTFQLPAEVSKKQIGDDEYTEYSCSTFAQTEAGITEENCSTLMDTERSGGDTCFSGRFSASDFDDLSRQASTELSASDVEAALWRADGLSRHVSSELSADDSDAAATSEEFYEPEFSVPPRSPPPTVCVDDETALGEHEIRADEIVLRERLAKYGEI